MRGSDAEQKERHVSRAERSHEGDRWKKIRVRTSGCRFTMLLELRTPTPGSLVKF